MACFTVLLILQNYRVEKGGDRFYINFIGCLEPPTWLPTITGHTVFDVSLGTAMDVVKVRIQVFGVAVHLPLH